MNSLLNLTPEFLLNAYASGYFPMAEDGAAQDWHWVDPVQRGILPLGSFHVPRSLRKVIRRAEFEIRINHDFRSIMRACAEPAPDRPKTWINQPLLEAYGRLHDLGYAHSVEVWQGGQLAGGLYGVSLGAAFFGESMFSRATNASKVALVHLAARLIAGRYQVLDTQFLTDHLSQFGAVEIPRARYRALIGAACRMSADFHFFAPPPGRAGAEAVLHLLTQTS